MELEAKARSLKYHDIFNSLLVRKSQTYSHGLIQSLWEPDEFPTKLLPPKPDKKTKVRKLLGPQSQKHHSLTLKGCRA